MVRTISQETSLKISMYRITLMVPIHAKLYVLLLLVVLPRSAKLQLQLGLVRPYIKNIQQAETECPPPFCQGAIYIGLHFMDLSQAEPFDGSAGSSRGFQKLLEASIVDIHTVQKVYSGATKYCTESVQWRLWRPFWILQAFWRCRR